MEELRNIWQHIVRKKTKDTSPCWGGWRAGEGGGLGAGGGGAGGGWAAGGRGWVRSPRLVGARGEFRGGEWGGGEGMEGGADSDEGLRKRERMEDGIEDASTLKKARVVWSIELHQQFVNAVNKLGVNSTYRNFITVLYCSPSLRYCCFCGCA